LWRDYPIPFFQTVLVLRRESNRFRDRGILSIALVISRRGKNRNGSGIAATVRVFHVEDERSAGMRGM
jgi:hypothetical protein